MRVAFLWLQFLDFVRAGVGGPQVFSLVQAFCFEWNFSFFWSLVGEGLFPVALGKSLILKLTKRRKRGEGIAPPVIDLVLSDLGSRRSLLLV